VENTAADYVAISRITKCLLCHRRVSYLSAAMSQRYRMVVVMLSDTATIASVHRTRGEPFTVKGLLSRVIVAISEIEMGNIAVWLRYRSSRGGSNASYSCV